MAHLINKDALVAEIDRRIIDAPINYIGHQRVWAYNDVKDILNTLEVKEVDLEHLEQEVKDFCYKFDDRKEKWYETTPQDKNVLTKPTWSNFAMELAKHFFELGMLSTITEEDCKLIWNIGDGLPCMKEEDFFKELLRRYKAQKGE